MPVVAKSSQKKSVKPMGWGQKIGLTVIGVLAALILYSVFFDEEPAAVNPTSIDGKFDDPGSAEPSAEPASTTATNPPE